VHHDNQNATHVSISKLLQDWPLRFAYKVHLGWEGIYCLDHIDKQAHLDKRVEQCMQPFKLKHLQSIV
jgi:hypothetical protein